MLLKYKRMVILLLKHTVYLLVKRVQLEEHETARNLTPGGKSPLKLAGLTDMYLAVPHSLYLALLERSARKCAIIKLRIELC